MKEKVLHWAWDKGLIVGLEKYSQSEIKIINRGQLNNRYSGPDFLFSCIEFDGITWLGHIEIHKDASDWYRHKHHQDRNYNSVILHVVSNDDCIVEIDHRPLPTLVVSHQLMECLKFSEVESSPSTFPCTALVKTNPYISISTFKVWAFKRRLERKVNEHSKYSFLEIMCIGFGGHKNGIQLHQLNFSSSTELHIPGDRFGRQNTLSTLQIKFKAFESHWTTQYGHQVFFDNPVEFYDTMNKALQRVKPTKFEYNYIIVNAVWPLIVSHYGDIDFVMERAETHEPEQYHVVKKFKELNLPLNNALDSQAYLEIYKQFCSQKKCLDCQIGKSIFKP